MHHPTAFVKPDVEHWLEREIAQWVHHSVFFIMIQFHFVKGIVFKHEIEQEPGVIYLHEMTTCLLGIF